MDQSDYYLPILNIHGEPNHNAFPLGALPIPFELEGNQNYANTQDGLALNQKTEEPNIQLGKYFQDNPYIKPLLPYEGDIIFEGRFGNSIRFGSTVNNELVTRNNDWSEEGIIGDPITVIRNGQSSRYSRSDYISKH